MIKLGRKFTKDELDYLQSFGYELETTDVNDIQKLLNRGTAPTSLLILWAYLTNNLIKYKFHDNVEDPDFSTWELALRGYSGKEDENPFIQSDMTDIYYWLKSDLRFSEELAKDIIAKAIEV